MLKTPDYACNSFLKKSTKKMLVQQNYAGKKCLHNREGRTIFKTDNFFGVVLCANNFFWLHLPADNAFDVYKQFIWAFLLLQTIFFTIRVKLHIQLDFTLAMNLVILRGQTTNTIVAPVNI